MDLRSAIESECAHLVWLYAYLNDERRFTELAGLFAENARLYPPSAPEKAVHGRRAILKAFASMPASVSTFHVCTDIVIEADSPTTAVGRSGILLLVTTSGESGSAPIAESRMPVPGTFRDRFVLADGCWRFAERRGMLWR